MREMMPAGKIFCHSLRGPFSHSFTEGDFSELSLRCRRIRQILSASAIMRPFQAQAGDLAEDPAGHPG